MEGKQYGLKSQNAFLQDVTGGTKEISKHCTFVVILKHCTANVVYIKL